MTRRRVVVTGLGIVSPVGSTVAGAWESILAGRGGIGPITRFDVSAFATRFGGAVHGFNVEEYLTPKEARKMDPFMHYGFGSAVQAINDSGVTVNETNAARIGGVMGAGIGGLDTIEETSTKYIQTKSPRKISPFFIPGTIINMVSGHISIRYGMQGPNLAVVTACTTSTHAIGLAMRAIQY